MWRVSAIEVESVKSLEVVEARGTLIDASKTTVVDGSSF